MLRRFGQAHGGCLRQDSVRNQPKLKRVHDLQGEVFSRKRRHPSRPPGLLRDRFRRLSGLRPRFEATTETSDESCGQSLLQLLNSILDFARLDGDVLHFDEIPFVLSDVLEETVALVRGEARSKELTLELETSPEIPPKLLGDPARLRQVTFVLLSNAVKFTEKGSVSMTVEPERLPSGKRLRVTVRDRGIGIPAELLETIFDPFVQAETSMDRSFGGTGLGLAIAKQIVEKLGGEIMVDSEVGRGSVFSFCIPLLPAEDETISAIAEPTDTVPLKGRILVVEDNVVNQRVATKMLERLGLEYQVAANGEVAVELFRSSEFDLVLMDCQMPVLDRYGATEQIRSLEDTTRRIPILALTANDFTEDRRRCEESGMDAVLPKPINLEDLHRALKSWISLA